VNVLRPSVRAAALAGAVLCAAGCDPASTAPSDEVTVVVQGDRRELELQEKSLRQREATLRDEQGRLDKRQLELDKVRAAADVEQARRIEEELLKLRTQQGELAVKLTATEAQKSEVAAKRTALDAPAAQHAFTELAAREAGVAAREARLAERELELAQREKQLGAREAEQASRDRAIAARQEQVATLEKSNSVQAQHLDHALREVPKPGVVEARHRKVVEELEARGVLIADLPPENQPLNAEIWSARRQGDFTRAADLVAELATTARHLKIDQRFVEQKMVRLQGMRAGARLADRQRSEVERLLREVTGAYSDGQYELANKGLNRIAAILDASGAPG
jgi:hypothetical protein